MARGATHFERYVMTPNRRLRARIGDYGGELIFHNCGEVTDNMI